MRYEQICIKIGIYVSRKDFIVNCRILYDNLIYTSDLEDYGLVLNPDTKNSILKQPLSEHDCKYLSDLEEYIITTDNNIQQYKKLKKYLKCN